MRGLEAMGGVGGTQLSGLHGEGDQAGGESEQSDWITEEAANQWNPLWMNATRLVVVRTCQASFYFSVPSAPFCAVRGVQAGDPNRGLRTNFGDKCAVRRSDEESIGWSVDEG